MRTRTELFFSVGFGSWAAVLHGVGLGLAPCRCVLLVCVVFVVCVFVCLFVCLFDACQRFIQICGRQHDFQRPTADRPQNQVRAIIMNAHPVVRGKRADACATILFLHGGGV